MPISQQKTRLANSRGTSKSGYFKTKIFSEHVVPDNREQYLNCPGTDMPIISVENLGFSYGASEVLHNISFSAFPGELIAVMGPNGVGKSTLFKSILGFTTRYSGCVKVQGQDIATMPARQRAQHVAYIPQASAQTFNYSVFELVLMGASPHLSLFEQPRASDKKRALEILDALGIGHLAYRGSGNISGGEYQLMLLARALMQNATLLVMDEPTANLDYGNQYRVMQRIAGLVDRNFAVLLSAHDPNQVLQHASRVIVLENGTISADGAPATTLDEELLSRLYRIQVRRHKVENDGKAVQICIPAAAQNEGDQDACA